MSYGRLKGGFEVLEKVGEGGFAEVYKVRRVSDGRVFALKVPKSGVDRGYLGRVLGVHRKLLNVEHPNIVRVYEVGAGEEPYILLEYIDPSSNLGGVVGRRKVELEEAARIVYDVMKALVFARQVLDIKAHMDLCPSNIFVVEGTAKVSDFDSAYWADISYSSFRTHFDYAPPDASEEALQDERFLETYDAFALGVIFLELVEGRRGLRARILASREELLEKLPIPLRAALRRMVDPVYTGRISVAEAIPFFEDYLEATNYKVQVVRLVVEYLDLLENLRWKMRKEGAKLSARELEELKALEGTVERAVQALKSEGGGVDALIADARLKMDALRGKLHK
ncbi:protein kinase [Infirmifilum lucidum]|uniref:non-specific serine/threonine protein kinase n=1 Tax=Infirmifilum lucidum TaxID=2776706 RepID=A0A7L9FGY2_9CREN|nr:protein kinase [Infirmifilum lucidum]QOJ78977.1 protein kinase [Infirmifilum lucidum]